MTVAVTITSTTGGSGTGAVTPEVQVDTPTTVAITGLTASTSYVVWINGPSGGHSGIPNPVPRVSDGLGNITFTTTLGRAAGQGSLAVYNVTPTTTVTSTQSVVANP
jgi:hypothetical protein